MLVSFQLAEFTICVRVRKVPFRQPQRLLFIAVGNDKRTTQLEARGMALHRPQRRIYMASTARDLFVTGLRNAHAMETQARELMERQSERLTDYPDVKARVQTHLGETEGQMKRLEQCLSSFGESTSTIKDTAQSLMGNMMAMGHSVAGDEILKNIFANKAFEHYEIGAYKSLLPLCGPAGADSARTPLEQSLKEEEEMAAWVDQNVQKVTMAYLDKEQ